MVHPAPPLHRPIPPPLVELPEGSDRPRFSANTEAAIVEEARPPRRSLTKTLWVQASVALSVHTAEPIDFCRDFLSVLSTARHLFCAAVIFMAVSACKQQSTKRLSGSCIYVALPCQAFISPHSVYGSGQHCSIDSYQCCAGERRLSDLGVLGQKEFFVATRETVARERGGGAATTDTSRYAYRCLPSHARAARQQSPG